MSCCPGEIGVDDKLLGAAISRDILGIGLAALEDSDIRTTEPSWTLAASANSSALLRAF